MAHALQITIDNHRYQLVNSIADGIYLVEINSRRRLKILLGILLLLLAGYWYQFFSASRFNINDYFTTPTATKQSVSDVVVSVSLNNAQAFIQEKQLVIDDSIAIESYQHFVYLYYDNIDVLETFLPADTYNQRNSLERLSKY